MFGRRHSHLDDNRHYPFYIYDSVCAYAHRVREGQTIVSENASTEFHVVCNLEEQYSIWPVDQQIPAGWRADGFRGPRADCLSHINEVWVDMRPLSLREAMDHA